MSATTGRPAATGSPAAAATHAAAATPLPRSAPSEQDVGAAGVLRLLDALEAADGIEMHSLMVLRHGTVVAEGWWSPYTRERPHLLYSLSKSFTSTAAGLAVAEGLLDLDDTVLSHFPELDADVTDPRSRSMLVRHVASMASGHDAETWDRAVAASPAEPVRGFLMLPPEHDPGTVFAYNQSCTYALAAIIQRRSGMTLTEYLRPRLLAPLGIGQVGWLQHPAGRDLGFTGLHATTEDVARLGQLHLQRGSWHGSRLLPERWIEEATRSHVSNAGRTDPDWSQGYGFQFWRSRHGYRGDGAYGQFCLVLPEQDTVVVTTAATEDMQGILDAVWEHLLPALRPVGAGSREDAADEATLVRRLAGLQLAVPRVAPQPASPGDWSGATFTPAATAADAQATLTAVTVEPDGRGWRLVLDDAGERHVVPLQTGRWAVSERPTSGAADDPLPVAAVGGWADPARLHAEVVFLETPHRLHVDAHLPAGTFEARWATTPLHGGPLSALRSPRPVC
jgi:CubicO group peptidase (beta-lactamase class C family)